MALPKEQLTCAIEQYLEEARALEDSIQLSSLHCSLPLSEVYDRIVFPILENPEEPAE